jgi:hypothetical protein
MDQTKAVRALARKFRRSSDDDWDGLTQEDWEQELRIAWWLAEKSGKPPVLGAYFRARELQRTRWAAFRMRERVLAVQHLQKEADPLTDPAQHTSACIRNAHSLLSPELWDVMNCMGAGMSTPEVAAEFGWTRATAGRRIQAAREQAHHILK